MIVAWRVIAAAQRNKEVRTQGTSRYKRKVHFLGNAEGGTRLYTEIDEQIEGVLTLWRRKKGKYQDTTKRDRGRDAHFLETAEGGTGQITERKRPSVRHSRPGDHGGRHKSGHKKEATERGGLTDWRPHRER
jgi:hypothetical protein